MAAALAALAALAACAAHSPRAPHELVDERTASTMLVSGSPLVFARSRSDVAAFAHDYATLVAVEIDTAGDYGQYLILYQWSTVDPRMSSPPSGPDLGELRIIADGRVIDLKPQGQLPINVEKRRELLVPNHGEVVPRAYKIDLATLRFIATSRDLAVRMPQGPLDTPYRLWEDGRGALLSFLKRSDTPP